MRRNSPRSKQLASCLVGRVLTKTFEAGRPVYTIIPGGRRIEARTADDAIAEGCVVAIDPGLFGPDTAQTWMLAEEVRS